MKKSAQSLAVHHRGDRALFPYLARRKNHEETNRHCRSVCRLSGPVCRCVATELTSRGNTRTAHASRCNHHTARSSGDTGNGRSHIARGKKEEVTLSELIQKANIAPEPSPVQMLLSSEVPIPPEQNATPQHLTAIQTTWSICRTSAG